MGYSKILKGKVYSSILRNPWQNRMLTVKQGNRLLLLQKKNKDFSQKSSFFADQLKERRKLSVLFPGVSSKYMIKYFARNRGMAAIQRIDGLMGSLERRLDSVLMRSFLCLTINQARQLVLHGFVLVNRVPVRTCSYLVHDGDIISFSFGTPTKNNILFQDLKKNRLFFDHQNHCCHLEINYNTLEMVYLYSPQNVNYVTQLDSDLISSFLNRQYLV